MVAGAASAREVLVVLALALVGLVLATLAAFAPWYGVVGDSAQPEVVELHAPSGPVRGPALTAADTG